MNELDYLIAGGGIAGLASGLALARAGKPARIFEQHDSFSEVGAGLQISPNAVAALRWLGAWEELERTCVIPVEIHVRDGLSGKIIQRIKLGKRFESRYRAPYRVAHRADLLAALLAAVKRAPGITLETRHRAISTEGNKLVFADGTAASGAAIIAADGVHSVLRQQHYPGSAPKPRGHMLYRTLIPFSRVPFGVEPECITLWLYPGAHVVHYAVSNWKRFNIVATIETPGLAQGYRTHGESGDIRKAFDRAAGPLQSILSAPSAWRIWTGADIDPLPEWSQGTFTLIGDAAHATLPYLAQGAAMSLEDACVLGSSLMRYENTAQAFAVYADARRARTSKILLESRRLGGVYHATGIRATARTMALKIMGKSYALRRNDWIYSWRSPQTVR